MTELTRQHDDLASVVALMGNEIGQDMRDVQRQVAPDVSLRRRDMAARGEAEFKKRFDPPAAPFEGRQQFTPRNPPAVDSGGGRNSVFPAKSLDPQATRVV